LFLGSSFCLDIRNNNRTFLLDLACPGLSDLLMGCSTLVITNDSRILEMATNNQWLSGVGLEDV
jgi:hypothetical protein